MQQNEPQTSPHKSFSKFNCDNVEKEDFFCSFSVQICIHPRPSRFLSISIGDISLSNIENQRILRRVKCQISVEPEATPLAMNERLTLKTEVKVVNFYRVLYCNSANHLKP